MKNISVKLLCTLAVVFLAGLVIVATAYPYSGYTMQSAYAYTEVGIHCDAVGGAELCEGLEPLSSIDAQRSAYPFYIIVIAGGLLLAAILLVKDLKKKPCSSKKE